MKKVYYFIFLFCLTGLVMFFTNPNAEKHKAAVFNALKKAVEEESKTSNNALLNELNVEMIEGMAKQLVNEAVIVEDYKVFSITKLNLGTQVQPVGVGLFTKVFIAPQLESKVKEEIKKYKKYLR